MELLPLLRALSDVNVVFWLKVLALVLGVGVLAFTVRAAGSLLGPLARLARWLCGLPEDVEAGVAHGARLLFWAAVFAAGLWYGFSETLEGVVNRQGLATSGRPEQGAGFAVSMGVTLFVGVALFFWAGYALLKRRPVPEPLPAPEPVVRTVPGPVRVVKEIVEKVVPGAAPRAPDPPPSPPPKSEPGEWDGVWRITGKNRPLPMFKLRQEGDTLSGEYAPSNYTGTYRFTGGTISSRIAEFSVSDQLGQRIHFRMLVSVDGDELYAEKWVTAEDVLRAFQAAGKTVRTPQDALRLKLLFDREMILAGKVLPVGKFRKVPDPGSVVGK